MKAISTDDIDFLVNIKNLLLYRKIVKAEKLDERTARIILDNNIELLFEGNEGCGGCGNGWFDIKKFIDHIPDNAITNVEFLEEGDYHETETFTINIFYEEEKLNLISYDGYDNGYYGTGFCVGVKLLEPKQNITIRADARNISDVYSDVREKLTFCEDCKNFICKYDDFGICNEYGGLIKKQDFCSRGVRKDGE